MRFLCLWDGSGGAGLVVCHRITTPPSCHAQAPTTKAIHQIRAFHPAHSSAWLLYAALSPPIDCGAGGWLPPSNEARRCGYIQMSACVCVCCVKSGQGSLHDTLQNDINLPAGATVSAASSIPQTNTIYTIYIVYINAKSSRPPPPPPQYCTCGCWCARAPEPPTLSTASAYSTMASSASEKMTPCPPVVGFNGWFEWCRGRCGFVFLFWFFGMVPGSV